MLDLGALGVIREIADRLVTAGLAQPTEIRGCSPEEVEEVERDAHVHLPGMYRAFLLTMGRGAGDLLRGSNVYYPKILGMTKDAQELLDESRLPLKLPDDAFAFLFHQGYTFNFFQTGSGVADPDVYLFVEGDTAFQPTELSFSEWLKAAMAEQAELGRRERPHGRADEHGIRWHSSKNKPPDRR